MGPPVTPPEGKLAQSPTIHTAVDPERDEIQARTAKPVPHSPQTETLPSAASLTPTPVLEVNIHDFKDPDSVPVREGVLDPLQLPPLPTTRSKPSQLDISQGVEEGGQTGSGRGESSGEGGSYSPATPEPGLPPVGVEGGQQPALVFKEDVTPGTGLMSPAVPTDEETAKPPFHLIIVNVNEQNQSGEWRGRHLTGYVGMMVEHICHIQFDIVMLVTWTPLSVIEAQPWFYCIS